MDSSKLIDAMNLREEDSKRISAILDSLIKFPTAALRINEFELHYDHHYNIFEVRNINDYVFEAEQRVFKGEYDVFKDGREAIDHCISQTSLSEANDLIPEGESIFKKDEI